MPLLGIAEELEALSGLLIGPIFFNSSFAFFRAEGLTRETALSRIVVPLELVSDSTAIASTLCFLREEADKAIGGATEDIDELEEGAVATDDDKEGGTRVRAACALLNISSTISQHL